MGSSPIRVAKTHKVLARKETVLNDSPVDCQSRRRPKRAVRAARALYFPPEENRGVKFRRRPSLVLSTTIKIEEVRFGLVAQLVRALACHARGRGFEPHPSRHTSLHYADLAHLVERHLAKVEVAGSSPVIRSKQKQKIGLVFGKGASKPANSPRAMGFEFCPFVCRNLSPRKSRLGFLALLGLRVEKTILNRFFSSSPVIRSNLK